MLLPVRPFTVAVVLALTGVATHAAPAAGITVFVQQPTVGKEMDAEVALTLNEVFAESLVRAGGFGAVTTMKDVSELLRNQRDRQLLGCDDPGATACIAEIAGALGTTHLAVLELNRIGATYVALAKLIDLRTTRVLFRESKSLTNLDGALPVLEELARKATGSLVTGASDPAGSADEALAKGVQAGATKREAAEAMRIQALKREQFAERKRLEGLARETPEMVLVPSGPFLFGCNSLVDKECYDNEKPGRHIDLPAFKVDRNEVTHAEFAACVEAGRCIAPEPGLSGCVWGAWFTEKRPMNCVTWRDAKMYCEWRQKRLPTSQEWEKAARGNDGRRFPWGNTLPELLPAQLAPAADETAEVGSFLAGASPFGANDMAGNVAEWTFTSYDGQRFEHRGGGFLATPRFARTSDRHRSDAGARKPDVGFRCAL